MWLSEPTFEALLSFISSAGSAAPNCLVKLYSESCGSNSTPPPMATKSVTMVSVSPTPVHGSGQPV